jgi:hypothetical protein
VRLDVVNYLRKSNKQRTIFYNAKVEFVGDNAAVYALIEKIGLGKIKDYTI